MGKDASKQERQLKVDELMKIIRWLDDYRTFRVTNPTTIEKSIQAVCPSDIVAMWRRVKKDINAMNDAISRGPLRKLIALATIMRSVATTSIMSFIVLFLAVVLFRVSLHLSYPMVVTLVFMCLVVIPNSYLFLDRYLRLRIREYHESLGSRFSSKMDKVKDLAQQLIFCMNRLIEDSRFNPHKNKFRLRHYDYKGLVLVKKRRFSGVYTVMPSIKGENA